MKRMTLGAALLSVALLSACSGSDENVDHPVTAAQTVTPGRGSDSSVAFGAWSQPDNGYGREQQMAAVLKLEKALGHRLAIDHFFAAQLAPPQTFAWRLTWDVEQHRTPMISFGFGFDTVRLAAGDFDSQLATYAQAIRASGAPLVLLRYAHEMDGAKNQGWVHSGPAYIAAWKHVRAQFAGLPVQWVWSPNAFAFDGRNDGVEAYYPGDDQVDWVAADGYNFFTCDNHHAWKSFDEVFSSFLTWGEARGKPMMIAEFGTLPDPQQPSRQGQWVADAVAEAVAHPALRALVYYNSDGHGCDWRLDSSPQTETGLSKLSTSETLDDPVPSTSG